MGKGKVPITMRALIQRINRTLAKDDEMLKKTRGDGRAFNNLGDYYVLDVYRNFVRRTHVDPEALGLELKCLQPWEKVVEEGAAR